MRRGQSWSMDVVLGVVIFGFLAVVFTSFALLQRPDVETLQENAERVGLSMQLDGPCGAVLGNDSVEQQNLQCWYDLDYEQVKKQQRLRGDFCVYLEDDRGQIILVDNMSGWGSGELLVGGVPCGQPVS